MKKTLIFLVAAFLLSSCANVTDIEVLDQRVREHEKEITQLNQELEEVKSTQSPAASRQAEMFTELQSMREELALTQDEIMRLERKISQLEEGRENQSMVVEQNRKRLAELKNSVDMISSQLGMGAEQGLAAQQNATAPGMENATAVLEDIEEPEAEEPAQQQKPVVEPTLELYQTARDQFERRNYEKAQQMWGEFTEKYPEHELVPNAVFWQGESYYQMREYARAVLKYQDVIDNYPESTKYRAALLKQGISFMRLGRVKAGKLLLQDVVDKYPNSPEAKRAKIILSGN